MSSGSKKKKAKKTPVVDEYEFCVSAMINKEKTKVLCLEVDSDFADVLLSFLTLPLGTIVRILEKHCKDKAAPIVGRFNAATEILRDKAVPVIGSLSTLRKGLVSLYGPPHFWTGCGKQMLLDPRNSFAEACLKLEVKLDDTEPTRYYYTCRDSDCKKKGPPNATMYYGARNCDHCGKSLCTPISIELNTGISDCDGGVFTRKTALFLISDDLQIMPNVPGSIFQTLSNLGITDIDGVELRHMYVGLSEIMDLLKESLVSKTPLTNFILNKGHEMDSATANSEQGISPGWMETNTNTSSDSKKMIVKAMVQKSTNKLLFLQAEEDFVDFLFSFLTIPLGGVVRLLGGKTSFGSVDNLYRSIENLDSDKHLKDPGTKEGLLNTMLPPMYRSEYQILPIEEQITPTLYYYPEYEESAEFVSLSPEITSDDETEIGSLMSFKDPKGGSSFVKRPGVFLVTDELNVVRSTMTSTVSIINKLKIPISDVGELEIDIGLEEALSILKASLTSTNALTNGLSSIFKKQPKQEHRG